MTDEETKDVSWTDERKSCSIKGLDERVLLRIYRFCKKHYEFWVGVIITSIIWIIIIK